MTQRRTWQGSVFIAASVDGFIALPDGDLAWLTDPPLEPRHVPAWKIDRLARSLPDARAIVADLSKRAVKLSIGGSVHDPTDPIGRLLFNVLAMVAEFEADLARTRTRKGMAVAKAKGRLRGPVQRRPLHRLPRRRTRRRHRPFAHRHDVAV